jgi:hypothetical protein
MPHREEDISASVHRADLSFHRRCHYVPRMAGNKIAAPRRNEALAIIVERIVRYGTSPCYAEIGRSMRPPIGKTRVRELVDELVELRLVDRAPGAQRGIYIRDLNQCRAIIEAALGAKGWWHSRPLGTLEAPPCTIEQLSVLPAFEHFPAPN